MLLIISALILAFFLGSIPFSWLLVWSLCGLDLRTLGSGNPGATNAIRGVGWKWGSLALVLDIFKGFLAVSLIPYLYHHDPFWLSAACGIAAIFGNVFCPFLKFKGGKAVATASGVFLGVVPRSFLVAALVFFTVFAVFRKISVGSLVCAIFLPLYLTAEWYWSFGDPVNSAILILAYGAALVVILRHRTNIQRLLTGKEPVLVGKLEKRG